MEHTLLALEHVDLSTLEITDGVFSADTTGVYICGLSKSCFQATISIPVSPDDQVTLAARGPSPLYLFGHYFRAASDNTAGSDDSNVPDGDASMHNHNELGELPRLDQNAKGSRQSVRFSGTMPSTSRSRTHSQNRVDEESELLSPLLSHPNNSITGLMQPREHVLGLQSTDTSHVLETTLDTSIAHNAVPNALGFRPGTLPHIVPVHASNNTPGISSTTTNSSSKELPARVSLQSSVPYLTNFAPRLSRHNDFRAPSDFSQMSSPVSMASIINSSVSVKRDHERPQHHSPGGPSPWASSMRPPSNSPMVPRFEGSAPSTHTSDIIMHEPNDVPPSNIDEPDPPVTFNPELRNIGVPSIAEPRPDALVPVMDMASRKPSQVQVGELSSSISNALILWIDPDHRHIPPPHPRRTESPLPLRGPPRVELNESSSIEGLRQPSFEPLTVTGSSSPASSSSVSTAQTALVRYSKSRPQSQLTKMGSSAMHNPVSSYSPHEEHFDMSKISALLTRRKQNAVHAGLMKILNLGELVATSADQLKQRLPVLPHINFSQLTNYRKQSRFERPVKPNYVAENLQILQERGSSSEAYEQQQNEHGKLRPVISDRYWSYFLSYSMQIGADEVGPAGFSDNTVVLGVPRVPNAHFWLP
ncbi:hypothetical protein SISNIDRAFT_469437 [Sistotremastrum niveocremeum HHB9708]|uniref:Nucleoplasmin-like domain-containing protein n=1 Tax=Sistotremastrum niveocremeum HHB9708 TaxID=1314777 RepID=A0A164Q851_9AGAM|nr:hypothetical protein SISNIDRAFT_469437 [Sistotremastrum niveocremeum HHB9708]